MLVKRIVFLVLSLFVILSLAFVTAKDADVRRLHEITLEHSGVYLSEDGYIVSLYDFHGEEAFLKNLNAVTGFIENCPLDTYVAIPPRKMDALTSSLPEDFPFEPARRLFALAEDETEKKGGVYIDLLGVLLGKDGTYFRTDHHWTSKGAYIAYREIVSAMGETPLEESEFEIKLFSDSYRGSDYSKKNADLYDSIYLYYTDNTDRFVTTVVSHPYDSSENNEESRIYLEERKSSYDPYTVYFGGNTPYITVRLDGERQTLLVVRDSFASALAPFLAEHFDLVLIDPRFYPDRLSTLIEREGVDRVLVLENMGSYTENTIKFIY